MVGPSAALAGGLLGALLCLLGVGSLPLLAVIHPALFPQPLAVLTLVSWSARCVGPVALPVPESSIGYRFGVFPYSLNPPQ